MMNTAIFFSLLYILSFLPTPLHSSSSTLPPNPASSPASISLTLEIADTPELRAWGLMGRSSLPDNHGMLFVLEEPAFLSFWMFNCPVDLSIAFIDKEGIIQEIHALTAYPEQSDPRRPIRSLKDLDLYPPDDPIFLFFHKRGITSAQKALYALEMEKGWFTQNGVQVGDQLLLRKNATGTQAEIRLLH